MSGAGVSGLTSLAGGGAGSGAGADAGGGGGGGGASSFFLQPAKVKAQANTITIDNADLFHEGKQRRQIRERVQGDEYGGSAALAVTLNPLAASNQNRVVELAAKNRLPAIYARDDFVNNGGLMSYGPTYAADGRDAARLVDKILKGTQPADLPVEQPTKFEFVINLKTAKALNLNIPQSVLYRADKVIK